MTRSIFKSRIGYQPDIVLFDEEAPSAKTIISLPTIHRQFTITCDDRNEILRMNTACISAVVGVKRVLERGVARSDKKWAHLTRKWTGHNGRHRPRRSRKYYSYFMGFSVAEWVGLKFDEGCPKKDTGSGRKPIEKERKFLAGGNFKMNGDKKELESICQRLGKAKLDPKADFAILEVFVCPPIVYIEGLKKSLPKQIELGAQNCYWKPKGAFTGEVSAGMIKDVGATWVILGHSERRLIMEETDNLIGEKICRALHEGLKVVACVGETQKERDQGKTEDVIIEQLENIAAHCCGSWSNLVIAYEPVWAIGTGKSAAPEDAQEAHCIIRSWIRDNVSECASDIVRIIYGGSVSKDNCLELIKMPDVDGFLVGGASLKPEFIDIINVIDTYNKEKQKEEAKKPKDQQTEANSTKKKDQTKKSAKQ